VASNPAAFTTRFRLPALWILGVLATAAVASVETVLAYSASPIVALAVPIVLAATVYFFYQPMHGVYAAILLVPAEALNFSFGSFGLTPTKGIMVLVGGIVLIRFLLVGRMSRPHPAYIAFMIGQVITLLGLTVATDEFVVIKLWVTWSAFLAVSMLVASREARQVKIVFYCLAVAGALLAIESIAHGTHESLAQGGAAVTGRAQGAFTHPAQLAFWLVLAISPALIVAVRGRPGLRPVMLGAAGLAMAGLLLTLTRGAIVGFVGSIFVLLFWTPFRRLAVALLVIGALFTALNFQAISRSKELSIVSTRLSTIAQGAQTGGKRVQIWKTAPQIIADHPLLGVGAGNFPRVSIAYGLSEGGRPFEHAHDVFLTIAAERGLIALAMLVWFLVAVTRTGANLLRDRSSELLPYAFGLCAALFGLLIDSLVDYPPSQDAVMATLMVEVGALIALERHARSARTPADSARALAAPSEKLS
jgi:O-antigen ligase